MLADEVSKYLSHKLHLAEVSVYYQDPKLRQSIQWAYSMREFLKYQAKHLTERDLAFMLKNARQHLFNLIPSERNKSYNSSINNFNKIINHCSDLLQPKSKKP